MATLLGPLIIMRTMRLLDLAEKVVIDHVPNRAADGDTAAFDNRGDLGRNAPDALLLRVDTNQGRDQTGRAVGHARQEELVENPDVVAHVAEGKESHAKDGNRAHDGGQRQERHVLDALEDGFGGFAGKRAIVAVLDGLFDGGKRAGKHDEAGQQQPHEKSSEDVVRLGDVVLVEQHLHVARVDAVGASQRLRTKQVGEAVVIRGKVPFLLGWASGPEAVEEASHDGTGM